MAITEQNRRDIFNGLEESIGPDAANHLMELLPTEPAAQLVTRTDMHASSTELRGEMAELRAELKGEMAELRAELKSEMAELRAELKGEMAELRADMVQLRADMVAGFATAKVETQRLIGAGMAANAIAVVTALVV